jgi:hypothetical protein
MKKPDSWVFKDWAFNRLRSSDDDYIKLICEEILVAPIYHMDPYGVDRLLKRSLVVPDTDLFENIPSVPMMICHESPEGYDHFFGYMISKAFTHGLAIGEVTSIFFLSSEANLANEYGYIFANTFFDHKKRTFIANENFSSISSLAAPVHHMCCSISNSTLSERLSTNKPVTFRAAKWAKRGWTYRILDVKPRSSSQESQGGTHASPRWHQRRGHWRHMKSGKHVWVSQCEVGDKARGGVIKDYRVTAQQHGGGVNPRVPDPHPAAARAASSGTGCTRPGR